MARLLIKCHPAPGFSGCFRAGRRWPDSGVEVEVVDSAGDPPPSTDGGVLQIGKNTLELLRGDSRFSLDSTASMDEVAALRDRITELEAENAALKAQAPVVPPPPPAPPLDAVEPGASPNLTPEPEQSAKPKKK
jgi:hypothetical protein